MTRELRYQVKPEFRADPDAGTIEGYAAVFDTPTVLWGKYEEVISRGAFREALKKSDVRALFNHDANYVLGRAPAGTLTLAEDETGLRMTIKVPETAWAKDLLISMKRGDISGASFGFIVDEGGSTIAQQGERVRRTITKVGELLDVSVVTYPAYEASSAEARSLEEAAKSACKIIEPDFSLVDARLRAARAGW